MIMEMKLDIGCIPMKELPKLLDIICKSNVLKRANIDNEDGVSFSSAVKEHKDDANRLKELLGLASTSLKKQYDTYKMMDRYSHKISNDDKSMLGEMSKAVRYHDSVITWSRLSQSALEEMIEDILCYLLDGVDAQSIREMLTPLGDEYGYLDAIIDFASLDTNGVITGDEKTD